MTQTIVPSPDQAWQFALILSAGMPAQDAIRYFVPEDAEDVVKIRDLANRWLKSEEVGKAILKLQGKAWQEMSPEARVKFAVEKVYNEMAYFLYSHNYAELDGNLRGKADKCREVLEQKLAGTAGTLRPAEQFLREILDGKVRLIGSANPTPFIPDPGKQLMQ